MVRRGVRLWVMGDLDDAIREHLELKRLRGADPDEVAREEREALAPVTRSHPIVVGPPREADLHLVSGEAQPANGAGAVHADENLGDATQEFHVHFDEDDWLEDTGA
jgi:hypothetical protein